MLFSTELLSLTAWVCLNKYIYDLIFAFFVNVLFLNVKSKTVVHMNTPATLDVFLPCIMDNIHIVSFCVDQASN